MLIVICFVLGSLFLVACWYFFVGRAPEQKNITWGVNFSQMQAEALKLDWKEAYTAILEELGVKRLKLMTQWDFVEGRQGQYYFDDIDWQIKQAELHNVKIIYVVGLKTGRWPECHAPAWFSGLSKQAGQAALLDYIRQVVLRYQDVSAIAAWQVENEPLFNFGICPSWYYQNHDLLKREVALVKSLDPSRPVIISDSGEQSLWLDAAGMGDMVGVTLYRKLWFQIIGRAGFYGKFPIPSVFYHRRAALIGHFFDKKVIGVELQAEPWASGPIYDVSLQEQAKTMDVKQFKENVAYAKKTGLGEFYFWGAEWWYWLKEKQHTPEIWDEAKKLF